MVSRTSATTCLLSLRHRCYSAYSPHHGEYQTAEGIGRRGMGPRSRFLISSSSMLTLGDYVLTVDNVTAALWWLLSSALHSARSHSRSDEHSQLHNITNCPLAFVPRRQHSIPCKLRLSFLSPASPASIRRTSTQTRLTVLSELSTDLPFIRLCHLAHEGSQRCCLLESFPALLWMPAVIPRART